MLSLKKILFPTDFSACAKRAFVQAAYLAARYGAELHVLHVVVRPESDPGLRSDFFGAYEWDTAAQLRAIDASPGAAAPVAFTEVQIPQTSEAAGILDYIVAHDVDLVVMGTQGPHAMVRFRLGSVAERILRVAPCPVFAVRCRDPFAAASDDAIQTILAPVDFSEHARTALRYAKDLAGVYGARLDLLHVVEQRRYPAFYDVGEAPAFDGDLVRKAEAHLQQLYHETEGPSGPVRFQACTGQPAHAIVSYARDHGTDLVVLATHGLTGTDHFYLGSVAEKTMRWAPCRVFLVRAFGKTL